MIPVLILQHPQEPKFKALSSAPLIESTLVAQNNPCKIKTGLSWRNLTHAWGSPLPKGSEDQKTWIVLYLGTKQDKEQPNEPGLIPLTNKGAILAQFKTTPTGVVLLDGTWAQSKTLWWRNSWLLKLQRAMLIPKAASLYGNKRKEPRKECVSTIEACAETLSFLGEDPAIEMELKNNFKEFLKGPAKN